MTDTEYQRDDAGNIIDPPTIPEHEQRVHAAALTGDNAAVAKAQAEYDDARRSMVEDAESGDDDDTTDTDAPDAPTPDQPTAPTPDQSPAPDQPGPAPEQPAAAPAPAQPTPAVAPGGGAA